MSPYRTLRTKPDRSLWLLALLLCGDVSPNPGPPTKPVCPRCDLVAYNSVAALQCDGCDKWLHRVCEGVTISAYRRLSRSPKPWHCTVCQLPAFNDSLFANSDTSSATSAAVYQAPNVTQAWYVSSPQPTLWFCNARSVRNKTPELQGTMASMPRTIFALCETWLDPSIHDSQLAPRVHCFPKGLNDILRGQRHSYCAKLAPVLPS